MLIVALFIFHCRIIVMSSEANMDVESAPGLESGVEVGQTTPATGVPEADTTPTIDTVAAEVVVPMDDGSAVVEPCSNPIDLGFSFGTVDPAMLLAMSEGEVVVQITNSPPPSTAQVSTEVNVESEFDHAVNSTSSLLNFGTFNRDPKTFSTVTNTVAFGVASTANSYLASDFLNVDVREESPADLVTVTAERNDLVRQNLELLQKIAEMERLRSAGTSTELVSPECAESDYLGRLRVDLHNCSREELRLATMDPTSKLFAVAGNFREGNDDSVRSSLNFELTSTEAWKMGEGMIRGKLNSV